MSFLTHSTQLKTVAGIALMVYGVAGHHALLLGLGAVLVIWGLAGGAGQLRRGDRANGGQPRAYAVGAQGLRPPFTWPDY